MTNGNGHTDQRIPDQEFLERGYGTDPTTLLLDLSGWARRLNELSVELAEVTTKVAEVKHRYKREAAMARERAKYRPARDRRTNADLDADVTRSSRVEPLALELCRLEAQRESLLVLVDNARMQVAALRTHAERG